MNHPTLPSIARRDSSPEWAGVLAFFLLALYSVGQLNSLLASVHDERQAAREAHDQWVTQQRVRQCRIAFPLSNQCEELSHE